MELFSQIQYSVRNVGYFKFCYFLVIWRLVDYMPNPSPAYSKTSWVQLLRIKVVTRLLWLLAVYYRNSPEYDHFCCLQTSIYLYCVFGFSCTAIFNSPSMTCADSTTISSTNKCTRTTSYICTVGSYWWTTHLWCEYPLAFPSRNCERNSFHY